MADEAIFPPENKTPSIDALTSAQSEATIRTAAFEEAARLIERSWEPISGCNTVEQHYWTKRHAGLLRAAVRKSSPQEKQSQESKP